MPDAVRRRSRRRRVLLAVLGLALIVGAGSARTLGQLASARAYQIPTNSMMPTLRPGDRVQADDAGGADPKRGEVWVLLGPSKLLPGGGTLVKRVIGRPGETVEVRSGRVLIDGRPIADHPTHPRYWQQLAWDGANLGSILLGNQKNEEAGRVLERAVLMFSGLASDKPD